MSTKRILSGMQPTNNLHLGNYLGALKNWVALQNQNDFECLYCVVDLHAMTAGWNPDQLKQNVLEVAAAYIACGVDPQKSVLFAQSSVPAHTELTWYLTCLTSIGWLNRMTQFKDKAGKDKEKASLGLYSYPVLMAADILVYKATHVPVGEDQKQHLELCRDIATAYNNQVGVNYFPLPEPQILGQATRVMSLRDGTKKMSKSDPSDYSRIHLTDSPDEIALKIRKAKSDSDALPGEIKGLEGRPEADNLLTIYAALTGLTLEQAVQELAGKQFSDLKGKLSDVMVEYFRPISERYNELLKDKGQILKILHEGGEKANDLAQKHIKEIRQQVGVGIY